MVSLSLSPPVILGQIDNFKCFLPYTLPPTHTQTHTHTPHYIMMESQGSLRWHGCHLFCVLSLPELLAPELPIHQSKATRFLLLFTQFPKHRHLKSLMAWWDFLWTPLFLLCSKPLPVKSILWAGLEETPNDGCHVIVSSTLHSQTRTFLLEQTCVFWISYYSGWIPFFSCNHSLQDPLP